MQHRFEQKITTKGVKRGKKSVFWCEFRGMIVFLQIKFRGMIVFL